MLSGDIKLTPLDPKILRNIAKVNLKESKVKLKLRKLAINLYELTRKDSYMYYKNETYILCCSSYNIKITDS